MELWIPLTVAAAFAQNLRSALQRHLRDELSTAGASYTRFAFGLPPALLYAWALATGFGVSLPSAHPQFLAISLVGGVAQIVGTMTLVAAVSSGNFAVGTAYSKTETVQTALFGIVFLGDSVSATAAGAIGISLIGVIILSNARSGFGSDVLLSGQSKRSAANGVVAGAGFGIAAVCYRGAALSLGEPNAFLAAATTLVWVLGAQTVIMTLWLALGEREQFAAICRHLGVATAVGIAGMAASVGWFTAMTLQKAAYVRALGQIELLFTFAASYLFFHERVNRLELVGVALVLGALLLLVLGAG